MRFVASAILIEKLIVYASTYLKGNMFFFKIFNREYDFEFWKIFLGRELEDILKGYFTKEYEFGRLFYYNEV